MLRLASELDVDDGAARALIARPPAADGRVAAKEMQMFDLLDALFRGRELLGYMPKACAGSTCMHEGCSEERGILEES